ncbi:MAG: stalk domain-containing protein [Abditibacteriales bacterium]|nr:stalk domain-containing protein [Abditibacteriales bacterium]MDW8367133.1 stalk domain-containing protein [Abditibacteriales bacterium]
MMPRSYYRRAVVMLTWGVAALLVLGASAGFAVTLQTATVLDTPDTEASAPDGPRVVILKPTFGEVVKGKEFPLAVQFVAGKHKLVRVELFVNDQLVGGLDEKGIAEFVRANQASFVWDTTRLKDGIHKLTVRVTDAENRRSTMSVHVAVSNVTVDRTAPMITFLQPRDPVLRGRVQVVVQAKDNFGVKSISVYLVSPALPEPKIPLSFALSGSKNPVQTHEFVLDTWRFPNGLYLLFAEVEDFMGNFKVSTPFRVRIANDGGRTSLGPEPPLPPVVAPPPGDEVLPPIKPAPPIATHPPRSVGPLTVQRSNPPTDQAVDVSPPNVQAPRVQPYVLAPEPRLEPKVTISHPDVFELIGSGEGNLPVAAPKPQPQHLASRPEGERRSPPQLSAERQGSSEVERVRPPETPVRSSRRVAPLRSLPPLHARYVPPASSKSPRMTPSEQGHVVEADVGSPPIAKAPGDIAGVGTLTDTPRLVSAPKLDALTRTPPAADSTALAVPPSPSVGVLPGRKPEPRISAPDVAAHPPLPPMGAAMIKALPPTEPYIVKRGDTLARIAAEKRLTVEMIREANPHRRLTSLKPGQTILLPRRLPIYINGELLARPDEPVGAFLMDSLALAPFRHIFERSGGFVDWNGPQRLVTGIRGTQNVQLRIGDRTALINGEPIILQAEPFILYGRTHVPIRFFEQALNLYVEWDVQSGRIVMLPKTSDQ